MDVQDTIRRARALRRDEQLEESQNLLLQLLEHSPRDPLVLYEVGGSYDVLGAEKQAIPYYRQAIQAGLSGDDLQECLVCLGSSYRVIGRFAEAVKTLETAVEKFPQKLSGQVFLGLAYYSNGQESEAVSLLLDLLLKTTGDADILSFRQTLEFYKDNLDEVWDE